MIKIMSGVEETFILIKEENLLTGQKKEID